MKTTLSKSAVYIVNLQTKKKENTKWLELNLLKKKKTSKNI